MLWFICQWRECINLPKTLRKLNPETLSNFRFPFLETSWHPRQCIVLACSSTRPWPAFLDLSDAKMLSQCHDNGDGSGPDDEMIMHDKYLALVGILLSIHNFPKPPRTTIAPHLLSAQHSLIDGSSLNNIVHVTISTVPWNGLSSNSRSLVPNIKSSCPDCGRPQVLQITVGDRAQYNHGCDAISP